MLRRIKASVSRYDVGQLSERVGDLNVRSEDVVHKRWDHRERQFRLCLLNDEGRLQRYRHVGCVLARLVKGEVTSTLAVVIDRAG